MSHNKSSERAFLWTFFPNEQGTPREYFVHHVERDPWYDAEGIIVATLTKEGMDRSSPGKNPIVR